MCLVGLSLTATYKEHLLLPKQIYSRQQLVFASFSLKMFPPLFPDLACCRLSVLGWLQALVSPSSPRCSRRPCQSTHSGGCDETKSRSVGQRLSILNRPVEEAERDQLTAFDDATFLDLAGPHCQLTSLTKATMMLLISGHLLRLVWRQSSPCVIPLQSTISVAHYQTSALKQSFLNYNLIFISNSKQ